MEVMEVNQILKVKVNLSTYCTMKSFPELLSD
jgi:hypothetical protein